MRRAKAQSLCRSQWRRRALRASRPAKGGPPVSRTRNQRIMLTTSAFAACFQFVVWTVSCLYDLPVQSLHFFRAQGAKLSSGLPRPAAEASPNLSSSTRMQSKLTFGPPNHTPPWSHRETTGHLCFKSAALTKHELGAQVDILMRLGKVCRHSQTQLWAYRLASPVKHQQASQQ